MDNFDQYRNQLPYPSKKDFQTVWYYKGGKVVFQQKAGESIPLPPETEGAVREVQTDEDVYKAARKAYDAHTNKLREQFVEDVKKDLGIENNPKAGLLIDKAWELGHSGGFSEVYNYAYDLVSLIED